MWRVRRPAGGPVTGTGSLRGSSFRLPCKRTTASSRLNSLSLRHRPPQHPPYNLSLPFSPTLLPLLSLFFCLSSLSADPPLTSFSIRPDARLRTCASLVSSRSSDRPAGRPLLSLHHHISRLLSSFARELPHARNTAHRLLRSSFFAASLHDANAMLFSRLHHSATRVQQPSSISSFLSLFLTSRSRGHATYSLLHSSSSLSSISWLPRRRRFVFFIFFVTRSSFSDRTGNTGGYATIYPTQRGQSTDGKDETRR